MSKLSALKVRSITAIGMHSDGLGLHLKVQKAKDENSLNKSWIYRWGAQGANTIGLGSVKSVSLAQAREKADHCRKLVAAGLNPREERSKNKAIVAKEKANSVTFKVATKIYIDTHRAGWRNKKHASQWTNTLKKYAEPTIGDVACSAITKEQVLSILLPIWTVKHETATRVRGRIESILDWAIAKDYRQAPNVAVLKGNLAPLLPQINKREILEHHEAMNYDEIPKFIEKIKDDPTVSARALLFCILTATRTSETVEATWSEINIKKSIWIIEKSRMKRGIEHRVPLSTQAKNILNKLPQSKNSVPFSGTNPTKHISNMTMLKYLQRKEEYATLTVHGFRSTFRDWAAEKANYPREVCEQALSHALADQTEAAYQRGDYFDKRKALMQEWADYCFGVKKRASD